MLICMKKCIACILFPICITLGSKLQQCLCMQTKGSTLTKSCRSTDCHLQTPCKIKFRHLVYLTLDTLVLPPILNLKQYSRLKSLQKYSIVGMNFSLRQKDIPLNFYKSTSLKKSEKISEIISCHGLKYPWKKWRLCILNHMHLKQVVVIIFHPPQGVIL